MGDELDRLLDLLTGSANGDVDAEELAKGLEAAVAIIRQGREDMDRVVTRAASLQDRLKDVERLESLEGWATAVPIGAAAEALRVLALCRQGSQECFLCPVTACVDNTSLAATAIKDLRLAAGELAVPIPEPGTDMARLLTANILLRRGLAEVRSELATSRLVASEAVAILQRLHQDEGLDLDGEVLLLMAMVRVAAGGGCGVCPLRETVSVDFVARSGSSPVRSTCRHPEVQDQDLLRPRLVPDVTRSQQGGGPPPGWCPLRGHPDDREEDTEPDARTAGRTPWGQVTQ